MKNIVKLALVAFSLPVSAWAQTTASDETFKTDEDGNVPAFEPATLTLYGSFRLHTTLTTVDEAADGQDETEFGLTDAYSRVGARFDFGMGATEITIKSELGLNLADLELGDPSFFDDEDFRVYSVNAVGNWGSVTVGKDWLTYYNTVGYPVDYFSSIYAGYTTYAFFRERMVRYTTPDMAGFSGSVARIDRTGGGPKGWQSALSYSKSGLTLGAAFEDMDGDVSDMWGASASYTSGPWYLSTKIEDQTGKGMIYNGFTQYQREAWTAKVGVGLGDQFSGNTFHAGVDYKINDQWKLFVEAYSESDNYAILFEDANDAADYLGAGGFGVQQNGKAILVGARFDISSR